MQKQILAIAMLTIVASLGFTALSSNLVLAQYAPNTPQYAPNTPQYPPITTQNPQTDNPSAFGQGASSFPPGGMGEHSSYFAGEDRLGIGNVLNQGDPNYSPLSKHPGELAEYLCTNYPNEPGCSPQ